MPFKKFLPLGLTLVAVSGCSHGDRQAGPAEGPVSYRSSEIEMQRDLGDEKRRFEGDFKQKLSEVDARLEALSANAAPVSRREMSSLRDQRQELAQRMQSIPISDRAEWSQLRSELQDRYEVLSASVDKTLFRYQSKLEETGEN